MRIAYPVTKKGRFRLFFLKHSYMVWITSSL